MEEVEEEEYEQETRSSRRRIRRESKRWGGVRGVRGGGWRLEVGS